MVAHLLADQNCAFAFEHDVILELSLLDIPLCDSTPPRTAPTAPLLHAKGTIVGLFSLRASTQVRFNPMYLALDPVNSPGKVS